MTESESALIPWHPVGVSNFLSAVLKERVETCSPTQPSASSGISGFSYENEVGKWPPFFVYADSLPRWAGEMVGKMSFALINPQGWSRNVPTPAPPKLFQPKFGRAVKPWQKEGFSTSRLIPGFLLIKYLLHSWHASIQTCWLDKL